jgi:DNA replication and repair protein RecF
VPVTDHAEEVRERILEALKSARAEEKARGITVVGPHRDDLDLSVNARPLKRFGSQGQQRTAALALKLAELALLTEGSRTRPLILFDDVMSELDDRRQAFFLERLRSGGQAVLTGTQAGDFAAAVKDARLFAVGSGRVSMQSEGTV